MSCSPCRALFVTYCFGKTACISGASLFCCDQTGNSHTTEIKEKIESIFHTLEWQHPEEEQADMRKLNPESERFSVPQASRNPEILKDRNLENEDIFGIIRNLPEVGAFRIFEKPEFWDSTAGLIKAVTTQDVATIHLPSRPLSLNRAQWHCSQTHLDEL